MDHDHSKGSAMATIISNDPTDALRRRIEEARIGYQKALKDLAYRVGADVITPREALVELEALSKQRLLEIEEIYGPCEEEDEHSPD